MFTPGWALRLSETLQATNATDFEVCFELCPLVPNSQSVEMGETYPALPAPNSLFKDMRCCLWSQEAWDLRSSLCPVRIVAPGQLPDLSPPSALRLRLTGLTSELSSCCQGNPSRGRGMSCWSEGVWDYSSPRSQM